MRAWVPYDDLGWDDGPPPGLDVDVWSGRGEPPATRDDVEFYVAPFSFSPRPLEIIPSLPRLRVVQTQSAGFEHVLPFLLDGVTLCSARGVHDASTAELAVALILASIRRIPEFVRAQDRGEWSYATYPALADKTVLIVGYGSIGTAIERRLAGFEVEILRVARTARAGELGPIHAAGDLPSLLPAADVVVLVLPSTPETDGIADAAFLARMKDGALLVNVGRGAAVDTNALVAELTSGRLRAAVDVTDPEPPPAGHPLWSAPNLLLSPHIAGSTSALAPRIRKLIRDQLTRFATHEPLANVVAGPPA